jgi:hypothetical protein
VSSLTATYKAQLRVPSPSLFSCYRSAAPWRVTSMVEVNSVYSNTIHFHVGYERKYKAMIYSPSHRKSRMLFKIFTNGKHSFWINRVQCYSSCSQNQYCVNLFTAVHIMRQRSSNFKIQVLYWAVSLERSTYPQSCNLYIHLSTLH